MRSQRRTSAVVAALLLAGTTAAQSAAQTGGSGFLEHDVRVLDRLDGLEDGDAFGWVAADLGDLDRDGVTEFAIPAVNDSTVAPYGGRVTVYSGATREELATHTGPENSALGYSTSGAGDVDGDGTPDYVAGAPYAEDGAGVVLVWSGATHETLWELVGRPGSNFGTSVGTAGDVDGDGRSDLLIGADAAGPHHEGSVEVRSGADGSRIWKRCGRADSSGHGWRLGSGVGLVGDVTGDGVPDVTVGAYGARGGLGLAFVLSGSDGSIVHRLRAPKPEGAAFGLFFASGAGDVNGDGYGDVFVGDYLAGIDGTRRPPGSGAAYVFSGRTGRLIRRFEAPAAGDGFGPGRGVGDVNGDGRADLIIAGYIANKGAPAAGQATVYSGRSGRVLQVITSTTENENFGVDALGLGDVDGDGLTDFLVTAVGLAFAGTAPGTAYVIAGRPHRRH